MPTRTNFGLFPKMKTRHLKSVGKFAYSEKAELVRKITSPMLYYICGYINIYIYVFVYTYKVSSSSVRRKIKRLNVLLMFRGYSTYIALINV